MKGEAGRERTIDLIISILARYYAAAEETGTECLFCELKVTHTPDCPVGLAWTLLDGSEQAEVRERLTAQLEMESERGGE